MALYPGLEEGGGLQYHLLSIYSLFSLLQALYTGLGDPGTTYHPYSLFSLLQALYTGLERGDHGTTYHPYSLFSLLQALYAGLERGDQCDLRLVCVVSKYGDENLRHTEFMRGIKTLAVLRKNFKAFQLAMALKTGSMSHSYI